MPYLRHHPRHSNDRSTSLLSLRMFAQLLIFPCATVLTVSSSRNPVPRVRPDCWGTCRSKPADCCYFLYRYSKISFVKRHKGSHEAAGLLYDLGFEQRGSAIPRQLSGSHTVRTHTPSSCATYISPPHTTRQTSQSAAVAILRPPTICGPHLATVSCKIISRIWRVSPGPCSNWLLCPIPVGVAGDGVAVESILYFPEYLEHRR